MEPEAEFQELVLSDLDSAYSYALTLAGSRPEAEDLLQEALLRAYRAFGSYKRHLSFKIWLFKIMKNVYIDRERRRRVRQPGGSWNRQPVAQEDVTQEVLPYPVPLNPEDLLLRCITIQEVREAIRRLPSMLREAVELRDIQGLSYQKIAEVIEKPIGTVMSRLYRGRNLLRTMLQEPSGKEVSSRSAYGL
jgi:RNA polymerase sigma-70 factor (ECF subfamily)